MRVLIFILLSIAICSCSSEREAPRIIKLEGMTHIGDDPTPLFVKEFYLIDNHLHLLMSSKN